MWWEYCSSCLAVLGFFKYYVDKDMKIYWLFRRCERMEDRRRSCFRDYWSCFWYHYFDYFHHLYDSVAEETTSRTWRLVSSLRILCSSSLYCADILQKKQQGMLADIEETARWHFGDEKRVERNKNERIQTKTCGIFCGCWVKFKNFLFFYCSSKLVQGVESAATNETAINVEK